MLTYILIGAGGFVLGFIAGVLALFWYQYGQNTTWKTKE